MIKTDPAVNRQITAWFITGKIPPHHSGAALNDIFLAKTCTEMGMQVTLLTPRFPGESASTEIEGINVIRYGLVKYRVTRALGALDIIVRLWTGPRPAIIKISGFSPANAILIFLLKIFFPKIPVVCMPAMYGGDDPDSILKTRFGRLQLRQLFKSDAILCMNKVIRESFLKHGFIERRLYSIKSAVDIEKFRPLEFDEKQKLRKNLAISQESVVIVTVGAVIPRKKQAFVTKAFSKALEDNGDGQKLYLIHVGATYQDSNALLFQSNINESKEEVETINEIVRKAKITDSVILTGHRSDVYQYLRAADIYIHASMQEGEANAVNEALSSGLPCLIPDEQIYKAQVPEDCAVWYPINDSKELARQICTLASDKSLRNRLGKSARNHILQTRSPEAIGEYYSRLFKDLIPQ